MELVRVLASGGFGIVYLARDHWLDRDVAVKEFLPTHLAGRGDDQQVELRTDADAAAFAQGLQAFIAEAKLLAHFSHPAIVKVHRFWEANGTGYMVMPYLRGPTLGQVRRSMSHAPTEEWLRSIMEPLMGALAALHAERVYHRDISPDNVLLAGSGRPVLLDFGAARSIGSEQSHSPTAILKPRFAPIEQYAEATNLRQGPWTDIYSLGALIAYLLEGTAPPQSTARVIEDEMKPLQERSFAGVSSTFLSAIDWALSVRPQDRPQSIAELRDALDGCAPARPFPATIRQERPVVLPKVRERAARPMLVALAGAALVFAVTPLAPGVLSGASMREPVRNVAAVHASPKVETKLETRAAAVPSAILMSTTAASTSTSEARGELIDDAQNVRSSKPTSPPVKPAKKRKARSAAQFYAGSPAEQCAGRGFFVRSYCLQRACKAPAFRSSAQCAPYLSEARLAHY
jgi:non-specific serine/threonine protein kinase